ncbi:MAG: GNAT family N-acetyltransferase [Gammaproteobacteria bacterium]|nr:GNAT family N-acetyltransferase [Gammaproteobacteria bacterium]
MDKVIEESGDVFVRQRCLLIFCIPLFNKDNHTENNSLTSASCCPTNRVHFSTGIRAWIEDVVVSEIARGKGVGQSLSNHAVSLASTLGAKTVDLTSRPSRVAANELYKKVGFTQRETNVYRYNHA